MASSSSSAAPSSSASPIQPQKLDVDYPYDLGICWPLPRSVTLASHFCRESIIVADKSVSIDEKDIDRVIGKEVLIIGSMWTDHFLKILARKAANVLCLVYSGDEFMAKGSLCESVEWDMSAATVGMFLVENAGRMPGTERFKALYDPHVDHGDQRRRAGHSIKRIESWQAAIFLRSNYDLPIDRIEEAETIYRGLCQYADDKNRELYRVIEDLARGRLGDDNIGGSVDPLQAQGLPFHTIYKNQARRIIEKHSQLIRIGPQKDPGRYTARLVVGPVMPVMYVARMAAHGDPDSNNPRARLDVDIGINVRYERDTEGRLTTRITFVTFNPDKVKMIDLVRYRFGGGGSRFVAGVTYRDKWVHFSAESAVVTSGVIPVCAYDHKK